MAQEILKTNIPRKEGYLYFCKGNPIVVYEAKMSRKGRPFKDKVKTKEEVKKIKPTKIKRIE